MSALPHTQDKPIVQVRESVNFQCAFFSWIMFVCHCFSVLCSSTEEEDEEEGWMESGRRTNSHHEGMSGDHSRKRSDVTLSRTLYLMNSIYWYTRSVAIVHIDMQCSTINSLGAS